MLHLGRIDQWQGGANISVHSQTLFRRQTLRTLDHGEEWRIVIKILRSMDINVDNDKDKRYGEKSEKDIFVIAASKEKQ